MRDSPHPRPWHTAQTAVTIPAMITTRHLLLLPLAAAALALAGCVERRITIGSDPPGALVLMNDQEIGHTPVTVPITWDGDYDLRLRYEKNVGTPEQPKIVHYYLHTHKKTVTPWFDVIPMDLVAELLPVPFKDNQVWAFSIPQVPDPTNAELIDRARALKAELDATTRPTPK